METRLRDDIVTTCFAISAISTLRGRCTLKRDEKGFNRYNFAIDRKIEELREMFRKESGNEQD